MSPNSSRGNRVFQPEDRSVISDLWQARFGMPKEVFDSHSFYRRARNIWAFSNSRLPNFRFEAVGLRMMSLKEKPWKPTTCALQIFGRQATKNLIHLNESQADAFLAGRSQIFGLEIEPHPDIEITPGYVISFYEGEVLGCGLYSQGKLISQIPKDRRIQAIPDVEAIDKELLDREPQNKEEIS